MIEPDPASANRPGETQTTWQTPVESCSYLPNERASLLYREIMTIPATEYESLLERGWRRHGIMFFRPACPRCSQCRSLRVKVSSFRPSKGQRRCWRRNAEVRIELSRPGLTTQHLELFNRYHQDMHQRRGWPLRNADAAEYAGAFLIGKFDFAYELRFFRQQQLIGVSLIDITPNFLSSLYFYHDPAWRAAGPGVFSMLAELQLASKLQRSCHYLGYWIAACQSMDYKSRYHPHELLDQFVADDEVPTWTAVPRERS